MATEYLRLRRIARQAAEQVETTIRNQERAKLNFEKGLKSMMDYRKRKWPNSSDIPDQGLIDSLKILHGHYPNEETNSELRKDENSPTIKPSRDYPEPTTRMPHNTSHTTEVPDEVPKRSYGAYKITAIMTEITSESDRNKDEDTEDNRRRIDEIEDDSPSRGNGIQDEQSQNDDDARSESSEDEDDPADDNEEESSVDDQQEESSHQENALSPDERNEDQDNTEQWSQNEDYYQNDDYHHEDDDHQYEEYGYRTDSSYSSY